MPQNLELIGHKTLAFPNKSGPEIIHISIIGSFRNNEIFLFAVGGLHSVCKDFSPVSNSAFILL